MTPPTSLPRKPRRLAIRTWIIPAIIPILLSMAAPASGASSASDSGRVLRDLTAAMTTANYAANIEEMTRLAGALRTLAEETSNPDRWRVHYQAGVAEWFLAGFVGPGSLASPQGDVPKMLGHLEAAAKSFEAALQLEPDSSDAHAGLSSSLAFLSFMSPKTTPEDTARLKELALRSRTARARSLELGPRNPRAVVVDAGFIFWAPPQAGGDRRRGLDRYREALELFAVEPAAERELHCWGEPDAWAFLASAYLAMTPPEPAAAKAAIEHALALRPDFAWARQGILPAATKALEHQAAGSPPAPECELGTATTAQKP